MIDNSNKKESNTKHPVWDLYNEYRTARFNMYYYEKNLSILRRINFCIEFFIALSVPSIASLWFWETDIGSVIWKVLLALSAFLAIAKPLVGLSEKIQKNIEIFTKWSVLHGEFQKLVLTISQHRIYDDKIKEQFLKLIDAKTMIKEPPEEAKGKIVDYCYEKVKKELPPESFFVPEE